MRENDARVRRVTLRGIARITFVICRCPDGVKRTREHSYSCTHAQTREHTQANRYVVEEAENRGKGCIGGWRTSRG